MAFTFQINSGIKFTRNEKLLEKAQALRPALKEELITPLRSVNLQKDEGVQGGITAVDSEHTIKDIEKTGFKRGESFILDFGTHYTGYFSIDIEKIGSHQDSPLSLCIRFAEIPAELEGESKEYDGWLSKSWIQEEVLHLDTLPYSLSLPRRYSFRYVKITVIDTSPKWSAVFKNARVLAKSSAEVRAKERLFSRDEQLQKICEVSVKTLSECMQEVFEDGTKRDRRLWLGDLRLEALASYSVFGEKNLVKRCLYLFGALTAEDGRIAANVFTSPDYEADDTFLLDYSLFFICTLFDYLEANPDDTEILSDLYPVAKKQMEYVLRLVSEEGELIVSEEYPVFIDWSNEFAKDSAAQGVLIYALKRFIHLAAAQNESEIAKYEAYLDKIQLFAREKLFDKERNLFISRKTGEFSIASQVWLVLSDVFSKEKNREIMKSTKEELFPIKNIATPYMYHHIAEAFFHAGLKEDGEQLIKSYWGEMISRGADTFWEAFDPDKPEYSPYGSALVNSYCHAWSCTAVYLVKKYL